MTTYLVGLSRTDVEPALLADAIAEAFPVTQVDFVQETTSGVQEVGFARFRQVAWGAENEHDLEEYGARELLATAQCYVEFARAAMVNEVPYLELFPAWEIPLGKTAAEYTAIAGALCAAAIEIMEKK